MAKKKNTFEQNMKKLEEIVESIEQGDMELDKTITLFEQGKSLVKECQEFLNQAELKINKLAGDGETTQEFSPE